MIPVYHSLHDPLTDAYTLGVIIELNFYKPYYFCYYIFFKKNGPTPASFSFVFGLFKQTLLQFLQKIYVKKCPSSIRYQDSNPRPSECESLPITTRPGLTPGLLYLII